MKKNLPLWCLLIVPSLLQIFTVLGVVKYVISHSPRLENNLKTKLQQQTDNFTKVDFNDIFPDRITVIDRIDKLDRQTIFWLCLISILPITILEFWTLSVLVHPLRRLRKDSEAIAKGNLEHKVNIGKGKLGDVRAVAQSINSIAEQLQVFASELNSGNRKLEERIEQRTIELQQVRKKVETANYQNSSLIAELSHELRSPLNAILGFTQIMQRDSSLSKTQQENLAIVNHSGQHLLTSLNYVLELSKIEAGRINLYSVDFDFYHLLDKLEARMQIQADARGLKFRLERHQNLPRYIYADEQKLNQILSDLLDNIFHFTPKGSITLSVLGVGEPKKSCKIVWKIENTSSGVTFLELDSLFNSTIEPKTKRQYQDVKLLGLPISRQLIRLMGGDIKVSNVIGGGILLKAHLTVRLGVAPTVSTQPQTRRVVGLEPDRETYRILVVDDSKTNRKIMLQILEPVGFEVKEAVNGREAVDIWLEWQPHMIWMDVRMPIMNGYEATERIKSHPQNLATSIVALTASTWEEERSQLLRAGCDDFVGKPFSESVIFEKIAQHLGVNYLYEEPQLLANKPKIANSNNYPLEPELLRVMPIEWLLKLEIAATELDDLLVTELLAEIPHRYSFLATALQRQADDFDFAKIIDLVRRVTTVSTMTSDLESKEVTSL